MLQSPLNCRFDKWASRHPKTALRQWNSASAGKRKSLLRDAPAPKWAVTDLHVNKQGVTVSVWG
jgi:hypothetical protein